MDTTLSAAGFDVEPEEAAWLGVAGLTLATWGLMVITWAHHLLQPPPGTAAPTLHTAGLAAMGAAGARRVHRLQCCPRSCCCSPPAFNIHVTYNCRTTTKAPMKVERGEAVLRRVAPSSPTLRSSNLSSSRFLSASSSLSTPNSSFKYSTYEHNSLSEIS